MENDDNAGIIYSINIKDIQEVANELLGRNLTDQEVILVGDSVGDYLDWSQAIEIAPEGRHVNRLKMTTSLNPFRGDMLI